MLKVVFADMAADHHSRHLIRCGIDLSTLACLTRFVLKHGVTGDNAAILCLRLLHVHLQINQQPKLANKLAFTRTDSKNINQACNGQLLTSAWPLTTTSATCRRCAILATGKPTAAWPVPTTERRHAMARRRWQRRSCSSA